jgi:indole-3-glycerol phosphate synthase
MSDILDTILERKRDEVKALRKRYSLGDLEELASAAGPLRGFAASLDRKAESGCAVIAEIKRASPSKGLIREDFRPGWLAERYAEGGAAALSVLTDRDFFQGAPDYLIEARRACELPVLRKDFMIDVSQIIEARGMGADCVLLIAAALSAAQMNDLAAAARAQHMDVLVEIHNREELHEVESAGLGSDWLLGINNRNLRSFETSLDVTLGLLEAVPDGIQVVTESGLGTREDMARMLDAEVRRFLIGESLMRQPDPGKALAELIRL